MISVTYKPREVAALMGLSVPTVIRLFENKRGVIILERPESMYKRRYRSIRIPEAVFEAGSGGVIYEDSPFLA